MKDFIFTNGGKCPQTETKVMLIDDDDQPIFLNMMGKTSPHLRCVTAWNGLEAWEQLSHMKNMPEIIFPDLNMPRSVVSNFRMHFPNDKCRQNPVIVMTTSADERTVDSALEKARAIISSNLIKMQHGSKQ